MKKSILNTAVSMTLSGAILSGAILSGQVYADGTGTQDNPAHLSDELLNTDDNSNSTQNYLYPGMGIGAATGTIIAGPLGFVVGGLIGAFAGSNHSESGQNDSSTAASSMTDSSNNVAEHPENSTADEVFMTDLSRHMDDPLHDQIDIIEFAPVTTATAYSADDTDIQLAQLGSISSVVEKEIYPQQENIMNILVSDLSLDVYFRSGSTDIEKFYPARLNAIADLVNTMSELELHLDGYTDRRGNKEQNIALANERINKVRRQLIDAGVDEHRIVSKAFGEAKIVSAAGNLEAYTFDRRVVIRFERLDVNTSHVAESLIEKSAGDEGRTTASFENHDAAVADAATRF